MLTSDASDGKPGLPLFDAVVPLVAGIHTGSAVVTYHNDNRDTAILIKKIRYLVASWFWGYWTLVSKYKPSMVKKLMESFDTDAAKLAVKSKFVVATLTVETEYADVDDQLDSLETDFGMDQWAANQEQEGGPQVAITGHREALAQSLRDQVNDIDDADRSGPSRRTGFSNSTGNSTVNSEATTRQHTLRGKALRNIDLVDKNYALENDLLELQAQMAAIRAQNQLLQSQVTIQGTVPVNTADEEMAGSDDEPLQLRGGGHGGEDDVCIEVQDGINDGFLGVIHCYVDDSVFGSTSTITPSSPDHLSAAIKQQEATHAIRGNPHFGVRQGNGIPPASIFYSLTSLQSHEQSSRASDNVQDNRREALQ